MPTPKVSVCIDVYNYAAFLPEAVESVLRQDFQDLELIVSDDCSTDGSYEIAQEYTARDPRVRALRNPRNLGMVRNRNAGLRAATGEYVKLLHADDYLRREDALGRMVELLDRSPSVALVASTMERVDAQGERLSAAAYFPEGRLFSGVSVITRCLAEQRNLVGGPSAVMFRRSLAARGFDETFFHAADLEMWLHLLEQGCFAYLREPLCAYRTHPGQQTRKDEATLAPAQENLRIVQRYLARKYVHLRRLHKRLVLHDAVRRLLQRSRRLKVPEEGRAAVREYGPARFWLEYPIAAAARHARRWGRSAARRWGSAQEQRRPPEPELPLGVNIAGFIQGEYGIGESSRALCRAVQATGVPTALVNLAGNSHRHEDRSVTGMSRENPYRFNLMTFSFDYARRFQRTMGPRYSRGRQNIGLWYWELERFPAAFHANFDYYDEIWTVTEFCRRSLAAVSPIPVHRITYPFHSPEAAADRARLLLPEDAFLFLFVFDYCSEIARKNPVGLARAFRRAFRPEEGAVLVLKTINSHRRPEDHSLVQRELEGLNALSIDRHLDAKELNTLYASCDAYVSLHRSEGLGLGMAQAMAAGKPVIATGYSGNLDFMSPEDSILIPHGMAELDRDYGPYPLGAQWADPDLDHAAEAMRRLYTDREGSQALGARAAEAVRRRLDPARTAHEIRVRLEYLASGPPQDGARLAGNLGRASRTNDATLGAP